MNKLLQRAFDLEQHRHARVIKELADLRMAELIERWGKKRTLRIIFGMGTEHIEVNGLGVFPEDYTLIHQALKDIWKITNEYRDGVPDDIEVIHG